MQLFNFILPGSVIDRVASGPLPPFGERSYLSTRSVESTLVRLAVGSILLAFLLPETYWHSLVCPTLIRIFRQFILRPGHDSTITLVYPGGPASFTIRTTTLPLVSLAWTSEESIVAAGHDCQPFVFSGNMSGWQLVGTLDDPNSNRAGGASRSGFGGAPSPVGRLQSSAFNTFRNADSRGISNVPGSPTTSNSTESELFTVHQNTITSVRAYDGVPGAVTRVSTSGVDGKLVVWDVSAVSPISVSSLAGKMGGMHLR